MRNRLLGLVLCLAILLVPRLASADVNDFTVTNFSADETLSRQDPQGELHIVERINVNFTDFNHGILRSLPDRYKGHSLQLHVNSVSSDTGASSHYTTYGSNGNTVLKIGKPDQTVTGAQEYTIDYTLRNVISFYQDHDELYWDVNGDQWQQPFYKVSVNLHLPADLKQARTPVCYTGAFGSSDRACSIATNGNNVEAVTTQALGAGQTLTYVAGFPSGYFQASKWYETVGEYTKQIIEFAIPVLILGGGGFVYWWFRGRDPRGTGIIVPQYDAPDGLKPAAVGTLIDFKLNNQDLTATIIDLAIRGYIKIIETKKPEKLRKDTLSYSLQLLNPDFTGLDINERILMNGLFSIPTANETVEVADLKNKLYKTSDSLSKNIEAQLTSDGYFRRNPLSANGALIAIVVAAFFLGVYGHNLVGIPGSIGLAIGAVIAAIFGVSAAARTAKGVAAKEHILGLKLYLNVAEKDRLEALQGPDAKAGANAGAPVKTVELFEKLLPYAMVLGVEQQWAKQFESLYTSPPSWYSGNWTTFNAYYLATSLNSGIGSAMDTAFSDPSSSSSSGFGGGFAGGGGGGGGGGGW